MPSSYPTAYRTPAPRRARGRGYQNGSGEAGGRREAFLAPPGAALGARALVRPLAKIPAQAAASALGLRMAAGMAARFIPWLGFAMIALELYELAKDRVPRNRAVGGVDKYITLGVTNAAAGRPTPQEADPYGFAGASYYPSAWYAPSDYGTVLVSSIQLYGLPDDWATRITEHKLVSIPAGGPVPQALAWVWPTPQLDWIPSIPTLIETPGAMAVPQLPLPWALVPYRAPDTRAPSESTQRGPEAVKTAPTVATYPNINLTPRGPPTLSPPTWKRAPREKEDKLKAPKAVKRGLGVAFDLTNKVTEFGDFTDALFDAVPYDKNSRRDRIERALAARDGLDGRIEYVLRHYKEIDVVDAIKNIIANQIEDYVIGKISKIGNKLAPGVSPVFTNWTKINRAIKSAQGNLNSP